MAHLTNHSVLSLIKGRKHKKTIDSLAYVAGVLGTGAVIPQAIDAWSGPAPGLSIVTWVLFMLGGWFWLVYAINHRQKPMVFVQVLGLTGSTTVVLGWLVNHM